MKNTSLTLLAFSSALILGACGGGGSTGGSNIGLIEQIMNNSSALLKGTAVDELILNAIIKVKKPDGTVLKTARTNSKDGTYSIEITDYKGPVSLEVSCDKQSKIQKATKQVACPTNLLLNSVANIKAGATDIIAHISPLSELVFQKVKKLGKINADNIAQASENIALIFGVNPLLDSPNTATYDKIVKSFHKVADANPNKDIFQVIKDMSIDLEDGVIDNSPKLRDEMKKLGIVNELTKGDVNSSVVIPTIIKETAKVQVENMIQSLRTQGTTMRDYAQNESKAIGDTVNNASLDVQSASDYIGAITDVIISARQNGLNKDTQTKYIRGYSSSIAVMQSASNPNEWSYTINNTYKGVFTLPNIKDGIEYNFTSLEAKLAGDLPLNNKKQKINLGSLKLTKIPSGTNIVLSNLSLESNSAKISVDSLKGSVAYKKDAQGKTQFDFVKLDKLQISAIMGDYTAVGIITIPKYVVNKSLAPRGGFENTTVQRQNCYNDYYYNGYYSPTPVQNCSTWNEKKTRLGNSGYIPAQLSFEGSLKNTKTAGEIKGKIYVKLLNGADANITNTVDNAKLKVSIGGTLLMPNRPNTLLNLVYENVNNSTKRHTVIGSYRYDTTMISFKGNSDKLGDNVSLEFKSISGFVAKFIRVKGKFVNGVISTAKGSLISKDGKVVAIIEDINGVVRVKYADGSFESIF